MNALELAQIRERVDRDERHEFMSKPRGFSTSLLDRKALLAEVERLARILSGASEQGAEE